MTKRKQISKKIRFEVFKRDSFTCQYCGRSAPNVVLHIEHIQPVAKGGTNDLLNLLTACSDCNHGKGDRLLSDDSALVKQRKQLDELNERREQLEMLLEWKQELQNLIQKQINAIESFICDSSFRLSDSERKIIADLIRRFGFVEVYEASEIAYYKYPYQWKRLKVLGGICYNRRKAKELGVNYYGNQESC